MRDPMERLVVLPFSAGCVSESSIAVSIQRPRRSKLDRNLSAPGSREAEERLSRESMKSSAFRLMDFPKPNISTGFRRMFKGFKSFSQIFVYKEGMEEEEMEMEIGVPTDVKHVAHIGLDGSSTSNPAMGCWWDDLISPDLLSLPSVSMPTHHDASHIPCSS